MDQKDIINYYQDCQKDETFDVVYGIESVCHAFDKKAFLEEAWRVLKPGGVLVILDGFAEATYTNITDKTIKTSKILYAASFPAYAVDCVGKLLGKRTKYGRGNVEGARYQYIGLKNHLWEYGLFKAVK